MEFRHIEIVYCDDIRVEVGNKLSLMGVYGGDLIVSVDVPGVPAVIPRLCLWAQVVTPLDRPFHSVRFVVERDGEAVMETEELVDSSRTDSATPEVLDPALAAIAPFTRRSVMVNLAMSPLLVEHDGWLRAKAIVDGEETLFSRTLRIRMLLKSS